MSTSPAISYHNFKHTLHNWTLTPIPPRAYENLRTKYQWLKANWPPSSESLAKIPDQSTRECLAYLIAPMNHTIALESIKRIQYKQSQEQFDAKIASIIKAAGI